MVAFQANIERLAADPVTQTATIYGSHGRAWLVPNRRANTSAILDLWMVEAPGGHPCWHSYMISLIHLAPVQGLPPPILYEPDATHEIVVAALDPSTARTPCLVSGQMRLLQPMNFAAQFKQRALGEARERVRQAIVDICAGFLSPDSDNRHAWAELFGDTMMRGLVGVSADELASAPSILLTAQIASGAR